MKNPLLPAGVLLLLLLLANIPVIYAHSSYTGRTLKSGTTGCGGCHATQSASVTVAITGPDSLAAGKEGTFQVTISGGGGSSVCVDIAASAGTLKTADGNLKLSGGELITNGVKSYSGGSYTYTFKFTAPASSQAVTLYATGMSTKAAFNFAPNKIVRIGSTAAGVPEENSPAAKRFSLIGTYPQPLHASRENGATASILFSLTERSFARLSVLDLCGREVAVVAQDEMEPGAHHLAWDAGTLPGGIYFARLEVRLPSGAGASEVKKLIVLR